MSSERLSDDTALCLAATALSGKAKVTPMQRELLRAVAECELVGDIAREVLLPAGLVKRNLERLMAMGLVSLRDETDPPSVPALPSSRRPVEQSDSDVDDAEAETGERAAVSAARPRQDSGVLPKGERPSQIRASGGTPDREAREQVALSAQTSSGDVVASGSLRPSAAADVDSDDEDWLLDSQVELAFERLRTGPVMSGDGGGSSRGRVRVSPIVRTKTGARGPTGTVPVFEGAGSRGQTPDAARAVGSAREHDGPKTQRMEESAQPSRVNANDQTDVGSLAPTTQPITRDADTQAPNTQAPNTQPILQPQQSGPATPATREARFTQPPSTLRVEPDQETPAPTTQPIEPAAQLPPALVPTASAASAAPSEGWAHAVTSEPPPSARRQPIVPTRLMNASKGSATLPEGSAEDQPNADAKWSSASGEVRAQASSPPPPRYSGIKGLGPDTDAAAGQWAHAVGDVGLAMPKAPAIPRVRVPLPSDFDVDGGGLAGQTIPLVAVIRAPSMIETVRGMSKQGTSRSGVDSLPRAVGSAKGAPSDPGGAAPNTPQSKQSPSGTNVGVGTSDSGAIAVPADPRGGVVRFGRTLVGVVAPAERTDEGAKPSSEAGEGKQQGQASTHEAADVGSGTLLGVLAPTADRLREQRPVNDFQPLSEFAAKRLEAAQPSELESRPRSSAPPSEAPSSDRLEHYQVLECLAQGGSGVVYKVADPQASEGEFLALKVLRQGSFADPGAVAAFEHEALMLGALGHPNVAGLEYFGRQNGEPFLLMQFVDGLSMSDLLHHPVPLPLDVGLIILQDALEALDYIHNVSVPEVPNGLVHCDISPQNLLVGADGVTRVIDFGSARPPGQTVDDAAVRCKPRYSSPEMMAGDAVDATSDVFSMGAVLFQVLSKQPAFSADPARRKAESLVPNPSMLNRRAPTRFDPICQRALDPDASKRYQSAREMLEALDEAVELSSIELRRQRVNFWVRRVIQSRHGDVEFDINELQELLEDNGGPTRARRNSLTPVPPGTMRQTEPEEEAADSSQHGAAAAHVPETSEAAAAPGEPAVDLRKRLWVTSVVVGVVLAVVVFALLKPDVFRGWFETDSAQHRDRYEGTSAPGVPTAPGVSSALGTPPGSSAAGTSARENEGLVPSDMAPSEMAPSDMAPRGLAPTPPDVAHSTPSSAAVPSETRVDSLPPSERAESSSSELLE